MKSHIALTRIVALAIALLIGGCQIEEPSSSEEAPPELPSFLFYGPNTNSPDPKVQIIKAHVDGFNVLASFFVPFKSLKSKHVGKTWEWNYANGTLDITYSTTYQSDSLYLSKMIWNGVDPTDGTVYRNWIAVDGASTRDGKTGELSFYKSNTSDLISRFQWFTKLGNLEGIRDFFSGSTLTGNIDILNSPGGLSGELRQYTSGKITFEAIWQPNGSGQWWTYLNGVRATSGIWN